MREALGRLDPQAALPAAVAAPAAAWLFWEPARTLVRDWWSDPEAAHGLLLAPLAAYLLWRRGRRPDAVGQPVLGLFLLAGAVLLRTLSGLAAELFTLRISLVAAAAAFVVFAWGMRQVAHWWLPFGLLALSVPLPAVLLNTLAFPLQLEASRIGAALLESRHVPVLLAGNVIHLPGRSLFVTEACSGLRSLSALLALGLLVGGLWLRRPWSRAALVALAVPVAVLLNGVRIFLTGFLGHFVHPGLADGFMHYSEGWAMFLVAFAGLGGGASVLRRLETWRWRR